MSAGWMDAFARRRRMVETRVEALERDLAALGERSAATDAALAALAARLERSEALALEHAAAVATELTACRRAVEALIERDADPDDARQEADDRLAAMSLDMVRLEQELAWHREKSDRAAVALAERVEHLRLGRTERPAPQTEHG